MKKAGLPTNIVRPVLRMAQGVTVRLGNSVVTLIVSSSNARLSFPRDKGEAMTNQTVRYVYDARILFAVHPAILTNHGLTRTALRWLERHGYVNSVMVKYPERAPMSDKVTGFSLRRRWTATPHLMAVGTLG